MKFLSKKVMWLSVLMLQIAALQAPEGWDPFEWKDKSPALPEKESLADRINRRTNRPHSPESAPRQPHSVDDLFKTPVSSRPVDTGYNSSQKPTVSISLDNFDADSVDDDSVGRRTPPAKKSIKPELSKPVAGIPLERATGKFSGPEATDEDAEYAGKTNEAIDEMLIEENIRRHVLGEEDFGRDRLESSEEEKIAKVRAVVDKYANKVAVNLEFSPGQTLELKKIITESLNGNQSVLSILAEAQASAIKATGTAAGELIKHGLNSEERYFRGVRKGVLDFRSNDKRVQDVMEALTKPPFNDLRNRLRLDAEQRLKFRDYTKESVLPKGLMQHIMAKAHLIPEGILAGALLGIILTIYIEVKKH